MPLKAARGRESISQAAARASTRGQIEGEGVSPSGTNSPGSQSTLSGIPESAVQASIAVASRPAVLIWIRQLKLEHDTFLARLKVLEDGHRTHDERLKGTEAAAMVGKTVEEAVKMLASRMSAMEEDNEFIKESTKQLSDVPRNKAYDEETRRVERKFSALDKRLGSIEDFCRKQVEGSKATDTSVTEANVLKTKLEKMESSRTEEGKKMQKLEDRLVMLEANVQDYQTKNKELQIEVTQLRSALAASAQPLPSVETRRDMIRTSPIPMFMPQRISLCDESPSFDAQRRRTARTSTHPSQQQAQIVAPQLSMNPQSPSPNSEVSLDRIPTIQAKFASIRRAQNDTHPQNNSQPLSKRKRVETQAVRRSRRKLNAGDDTSQTPAIKESLIVKLKTPLAATTLNTLSSSTTLPRLSARLNPSLSPKVPLPKPTLPSKPNFPQKRMPVFNSPTTRSAAAGNKTKAAFSANGSMVLQDAGMSSNVLPPVDATKKPPRKRERRIIVPVEEGNLYVFE